MKDNTEKPDTPLTEAIDGTEEAKECLLPTCKTVFIAKYENQDYCRPAHQRAAHKLAKAVGTLIVLSGTLFCECVGGVFQNGRKGHDGKEI